MRLGYSHTVLIIIATAVAAVLPASGQPAAKKLIEYGWDVPAPSFVAANIRAMEKLPFEGLIMRVPKIGSIFANEAWSEDEVASEFEALKNIKWDKFTDNFVIMYAASEMDWFSDEDWKDVLHNIALCAKAAKLGRCKGICFDAEPYGKNPWHYPAQAHAADKTFAEYEAIARKRGAQFMDKIEEGLPNPVIHTFFLMAYFRDLVDEPDPSVVKSEYSKRHYGLLPAFLEGMLDVADPGTIITDGNESAYYYQSADQYTEVRDIVKNQAWRLISPQNQDKYRKQVQCSQALYVDHLFDMRTHKNISQYMTEEERAQWFQHNVYHALRTADEYVWLYSERMNWWTNRDLPAGLPESVVAAKTKLAAGQELGYELKPIIDRATDRMQAAIREKLLMRAAEIPGIDATDAPPTVDGRLGDDIWKKTSALQAFVPYFGIENDPTAQTLAWITYDKTHLYVAVRCDEPNMAGLNSIGTRRDQDVWLGDSVDIFVSPGAKPTPYYHIIISPANALWDAFCDDGQDLGWNPDCRSATYRGPDHWTLELALPWSAMNMSAPKPGTSILANICRQRIPQPEQTSWSQCIGGFVEPASFGTLTLK